MMFTGRGPFPIKVLGALVDMDARYMNGLNEIDTPHDCKRFFKQHIRLDSLSPAAIARAYAFLFRESTYPIEDFATVVPDESRDDFLALAPAGKQPILEQWAHEGNVKDIGSLLHLFHQERRAELLKKYEVLNTLALKKNLVGIATLLSAVLPKDQEVLLHHADKHKSVAGLLFPLHQKQLASLLEQNMRQKEEQAVVFKNRFVTPVERPQAREKE